MWGMELQQELCVSQVQIYAPRLTIHIFKSVPIGRSFGVWPKHNSYLFQLIFEGELLCLRN